MQSNIRQLHVTTRSGRGGTAVRRDVTIETYAAIEYEFYIPAAIWDHQAVRVFRDELQSLEKGATIFKGTIGIWQEITEQTHIYRVTLRRDRFQPDNFVQAIQNRIARMMADLTESLEAWQEEVIFTAKEIMVSCNKLPKVTAQGIP